MEDLSDAAGALFHEIEEQNIFVKKTAASK
jgi:hypothetical protein